MADIYTDLQVNFVPSILAPTSQGGLGQGTVILKHSEPGAPNPAEPWNPVEPVVTSETMRAAVRGVDKRLVGTEVGGQVIVASDRIATCATPKMEYAVGDTLSVDGKPVNILSVERIPAAGIAAAVKFIIRG